jgi:hypothetical protein
MSDIDDIDSEDERIFRLEAGLIYSTTRLRVLEGILGSLFQQIGIQVENQTFGELVHSQSESALRELLRHYADHDPDFSARLSRYFDEIKKRDTQ